MRAGAALLPGWVCADGSGAGQGVGGSFHDAQGNPLINKQRFPDMAAMTAYGRQRGIKIGWWARGRSALWACCWLG